MNMPPITPTPLWNRDENGERTPNERRRDGPDEELSKCGGPLDEGETDGLDVKLEEESWDTRVGFEYPFVVCDTILVRMERLRAWGNIGYFDDTEVNGNTNSVGT